MRPVAKFAAISLGTIFVVFGVAWLLLGVGVADLGFHGTVALLLGVVLSALLGVGLMALVFFSNRSGRDDRVGGSRGPGVD